MNVLRVFYVVPVISTCERIFHTYDMASVCYDTT